MVGSRTFSEFNIPRNEIPEYFSKNCTNHDPIFSTIPKMKKKFWKLLLTLYFKALLK